MKKKPLPEWVKKMEGPCSDSPTGKHHFTTDLEYGITGQTFSCEYCGEPMPERTTTKTRQNDNTGGLKFMSKQELKELDAWIASNIFMFYVHTEGKVLYISQFRKPDWKKKFGLLPEYTTDPAAAMEVLKACADQSDTPIHVWHRQDEHYKGLWHVADNEWRTFQLNESLELAICLFAKKLFSK